MKLFHFKYDGGGRSLMFCNKRWWYEILDLYECGYDDGPLYEIKTYGEYL